MFALHRVSFRQLLLVAFLLIAGLLAAVSLRGLVTLERLMSQARQASEASMRLAAEAQALMDHSVSMERAARQYLVLEDRALRQRYEDAAREGEAVLSRLAPELPSEQVNAWRERAAQVAEQMQGPRANARLREQSLILTFRELADINATIALQIRRAGEERTRRVQDALEASRLAFGRQVLVAIAVAVLLALGFGLWLARPFKRLERAIVGLGENRLERPIEIRGPADVRQLGRRLEWLRLRLAELDADKARFLRHVSHELKTPLAAMREGVALLEDEVAGPLTGNQKEVVRILSENTARLQSQIEDLLRFNAAAFEARRLQRQQVDLAALLQRLLDEQKLQWQAKQLQVRIEGCLLYTSPSPRDD